MNKQYKKIIFHTDQHVKLQTTLEITEDLFYKITNELHCEPKITFPEFYNAAIGNEFFPYVHFDYYVEKSYTTYSKDYYTGDEEIETVEAGLKRYYNSIDKVIINYIKAHSSKLKPNIEAKNLTEESSYIDVPGRVERYE